MTQECFFDLDGIRLNGIRWGKGNRVKVIALHGWLDNAASFSLIAPYLKELDIVALDLAGHGRSGFRQGVGAYNIWQDVSEISQVAEQLSWDCFSIIGHSRGAMIGSLYTGTFPSQISGLCLLDAIVPVTAEASELPRLLADSIRGLRNLNDRLSTYYPDYEQAALARMRGIYPLSEQASRLLASRSVSEDAEKGFFWSYDKRLLIASEIRFSEAQAKAFVDAFGCTAKVIFASSGFVLEHTKPWYIEHPKLDMVQIDGEHHLQLSDKQERLIQLAQHINDYFAKK